MTNKIYTLTSNLDFCENEDAKMGLAEENGKCLAYSENLEDFTTNFLSSSCNEILLLNEAIKEGINYNDQTYNVLYNKSIKKLLVYSDQSELIFGELKFGSLESNSNTENKYPIKLYGDMCDEFIDASENKIISSTSSGKSSHLSSSINDFSCPNKDEITILDYIKNIISYISSPQIIIPVGIISALTLFYVTRLYYGKKHLQYNPGSFNYENIFPTQEESVSGAMAEGIKYRRPSVTELLGQQSKPSQVESFKNVGLNPVSKNLFKTPNTDTIGVVGTAIEFTHQEIT
ncbi:hypothetical protein SZ25_00296 [Candidatus Arcanobacter lacustris]|uniref:Uncharacterized protein n=1 Tax=Candidatus Arcanibacter lacustris TaxID=1607817 RepID=A0A0F5MPI6_9RICK|nr:hypothetical protein SZ25_00296 [Candidatus Arcanobacter lacustris]